MQDEVVQGELVVVLLPGHGVEGLVVLRAGPLPGVAGRGLLPALLLLVHGDVPRHTLEVWRDHTHGGRGRTSNEEGYLDMFVYELICTVYS